MTSQLQRKFDCRVSSVFNKDTRNYGKKFMFDNCGETCWNSDSGSPQWIKITFEEEVPVSSIRIEFQGGFVGQNCQLEVGSDEKDLTEKEKFFPEDKNCLQEFPLRETAVGKVFKLVFNESTDFFGRIIVYKVDLCS